MEQWKRAVFPLILLFSAMMFDGVLTMLFHMQLQTSFGMMVPRLTLLFLIIFAFYLRPSHVTTLSLVFGFMFDSFYTGYLGIYMASFAFVGYIVLQLRAIFHQNVLVYSLLSVILLTVVEFFLYGVYRTLGVTLLAPQEFVVQRLGATLLFNAVLMLIISWPLDRLTQFIVRTEDKKYKTPL